MPSSNGKPRKTFVFGLPIFPTLMVGVLIVVAVIARWAFLK